jgi:hypothetical protein
MEMHGRAGVESADDQACSVNGGSGRDLAGSVADNAGKAEQDLALTAVIVGVTTGIRIAFQAGIGSDSPDLDIHRPGVAVDPLLERDGLLVVAGSIAFLPRGSGQHQSQADSER